MDVADVRVVRRTPAQPVQPAQQRCFLGKVHAADELACSVTRRAGARAGALALQLCVCVCLRGNSVGAAVNRSNNCTHGDGEGELKHDHGGCGKRLGTGKVPVGCIDRKQRTRE